MKRQSLENNSRGTGNDVESSTEEPGIETLVEARTERERRRYRNECEKLDSGLKSNSMD
jgi:hypothetical protein